MNDQATDLTKLVARLERLERQFRCTRLVGVAMLLLAGILTLGASQSKVPKVVEAERFSVKDASGIESAAIVVGKDGPALYLYDEKQKARLLLTVDKNGPGIMFLTGDDKKPTRLHLAGDSEGSAALFHDQNGDRRAALYVSKKVTALQFFDQMRRPRVSVELSSTGPRFLLFDEKGQPVFVKPDE